MYFVHYKNMMGYSLNKFDTLDEAQGFVRELAGKGHKEFYLSQEIPFKVKVEVEF